MADFSFSQGGGGRPKAVLTAHHVAVCILVRLYLEPADAAQWMEESDFHQLGNLVLRLIHCVDVLRVRNLADLMAVIEDAVDDPDLVDSVGRVLQTIFSTFTCPDILLDFFRQLADLLGNSNANGVSESEPARADLLSALGVFIRKCFMSLHVVPFEQMCRLFKEVRAFPEAGQQQQQQQQGTARRVMHPSAADDDSDLLYADSATLTREVGRQAPAVMQRRLDVQVQRAPWDKHAHLLQHTHDLLHQNYFSAVDSLHHNFDLTGSLEGAGRRAAEGSHGTHGPHDADRGMFQSALLSLASLQAHMGHIGEGLTALNEAVRIAQQQNDNQALAHALACLCRILSAAAPPTGPTQLIPGVSPAASAHLLQLLRLLRRCLKRSLELHEPHLIAYALLALASFRLRHRVEPAASLLTPSPSAEGGEGASEVCAQAQQAIEYVLDHQYLMNLTAVSPPPINLTGAPTAGGMNVPRLASDLFTSTAYSFNTFSVGRREASAQGVDQLAAASLLLQSAAWERAGMPRLAQAASLQLLDTFSAVARAEDQCLAYAQLLTSAAASLGYSDAVKVLAVADKQFPYGENRALAAARISVAQKRAVQRKDVQHARQLAAQLAGLPSTSDAVDLDLRVEAEVQSINALLAGGSFEEAAAAAQSLFSLCLKAGSQVEAARLLLLLGDIFRAAGSPLGAVPYILSCSQHASVLQLPMLAAEAGMKLGLAGLSLGEGAAYASRRRVFECLPVILGRAPLGLQVQAHMAHVHALLTSASAEEIRLRPAKVLKPLQEAARLYGELEDWSGAAEAHHLIALVCHTARDIGQRNAAAAEFHRYSAKLQLAC